MEEIIVDAKPDYLTDREFACIEAYFRLGSKKQAAIEAGYSPRTATQAGARVLNSEKAKRYMAERDNLIVTDKVAGAQEILQYLTRVMRGEEVDELSDGRTKKISVQERTKAAQELAKRMLDTKQDTKTVINIINDIPRDE